MNWIGDFYEFSEGTVPESYVSVRLEVRRAIDQQLSNRVAIEPPSDEAIARAADQLEGVACYGRQAIDEDVGVKPAAVATEFARRIEAIRENLAQLLTSPLAKVAAAIGARAEVGFAVNALATLAYISNAPEGLQYRCQDMIEDFETLSQLICDSDEPEHEELEAVD